MSDTNITAFQPTSLEQAEKFAKLIAGSALLPDALRGKPGDVLVTLITGHELGLSPMQSIRGLHVIKGKAVMSADLTVALVKKHPECICFRLVESTDAIATYETERKAEGKTKMSFTIEQARQAGLSGDNWRKYPAAMLRARCSSALARAVYPDLTLGVYDPDEAEEIRQTSEREINPPPQSPVQAQPEPTKAQTQTEKVKALLQKTTGFKPQAIVDAKADEAEEQAEARAAVPTVWFGPLKGTPIHELSNEQLSACIDEVQATIDSKPDSPSAGKLKRGLAAFQMEMECRQEQMSQHTEESVPS